MHQANKNDSLRVVVGYHRLRIPMRGETIHFQPLEHLTSITFTRGGGAIPTLENGVPNLKPSKSNLEVAEVIISYT